MNDPYSFSQSNTLRPDVVGQHLTSSVAAVLPLARAFGLGEGTEFGFGRADLPPKYRMEDGSVIHLCWSIVVGKVPSLDLFVQQNDRQTTIRFMDAEVCDPDDDAAIRERVATLMEQAAAVSEAYMSDREAPDEATENTLALCLVRDEEVRRRIPAQAPGDGMVRMTIPHDPSAMIEHPSPWTRGGFGRIAWMDPDEQMAMDRAYLDAAPRLIGVDAAMWAVTGSITNDQSVMGYSIKLNPHRKAFRTDGIDPMRRMRLMALGRDLLDRAAGGNTH